MPDFSAFRSTAYALMRIFVGLMYFSHGAQKIFGWFGGMGENGGPIDNYVSIQGLAGFVELIAGGLVTIGAFTPVAAAVSALELLGVYGYAHVMGFGQGGFDLFWWSNGGELAAVYFFVFLYVMTVGAGKWSVDALRGGTAEA